MRLILTILGVLAAMAVGAFGLFYLFIVQPINRAMAPATPQNARVELLAEKPDGVILMPFVTGDEPRLVRGETLQRLAPQLWFTSTTEAGNIVGAVMFGMMGLPPLREIATTFREGAPLKEHTCLTIGCMHWATAQPQMWGMDRLKGMGDALGPKVEKQREAFSDHTAYRKAHAAVTADPKRWFTNKLASQPQPPPDGMREVSIALPSRIVRTHLDGSQPREDAALRAEIEALARSLLEGTGGRLQSVSGITQLPFWAQKNGDYLRASDGASRAIPNLALLNPHLTLRVPKAEAERVNAAARQKAGAGTFPLPETAVIDQAIASAFRGWGIDTSCLPACGSALPAQPLQMTSEISLSPPPLWTLEYWVVPVDRRQ
jgi:hypothetical protein